MRIGIDIDDTICYSIENMLPYICKYYNLDYEEEKKKHLSYDDYQKLPNYYDFAIKTYEKVMPNAFLKEGADYYINKLKNLGHEIIFITARSELGFKEPYRVSAEYLEKSNISYDKLFVAVKDKGMLCSELKIDLFIDDNPRNCDSVYKENIKVLLFDNKFNKNINNFERVNNWNEIYDKIKNQQIR